MSFGGGSSSAAAPPTFTPVDINSTAKLATQYDTAAYARSDADFAQRHPELVSARNSTIADASKQLTGNIGDIATGALATAGLTPEAAGMNTGNEFTSSRSSGDPITAKEGRDRNYFETLLAANPARSSFSGADAVRIALGNTGNQNALNSALFTSNIQDYNTQQAQAGQNIGAYANILGGAATNFAKLSSAPKTAGSPYLDPFSGGAYNLPVYTNTYGYGAGATLGG
jgi:hypothetical protein